MKNDSDCTINENEKKKKHFEGVIIKDRETLRNIIKKAGKETIEDFLRVDAEFATNPIFALKVIAMISSLQVRTENAIMPRGIDEE